MHRLTLLYVGCLRNVERCLYMPASEFEHMHCYHHLGLYL